MRSTALLIALFDLVVGITALVSPDNVMSVRRNYLATPVGFYAVGALYFAIGLVLILFGPASRMPKTLRALGAVTGVRGIAAPLFGTVERALAILEWETMQGPTFLRAGAVVALATGGVVAFAAIAPSHLYRSRGRK
jgi:hypothetical protein